MIEIYRSCLSYFGISWFLKFLEIEDFGNVSCWEILLFTICLLWLHNEIIMVELIGLMSRKKIGE